MSGGSQLGLTTTRPSSATLRVNVVVIPQTLTLRLVQSSAGPVPVLKPMSLSPMSGTGLCVYRPPA